MKVNKNFRLFFSLVLLVLPTLSQAQTNILLAVGDSITQGEPPYNSGIGGNGCRCGGYIKYLDPLLNNSGWVSQVYNYGINGDSVSEAAIRTPGLIDSKNPNFVLFMAGTNDLWTKEPEHVKIWVKYAINQIQGKGKIPIVGTLLPDTRGSINWDPKEIPEANNLIRQVLIDKGVTKAEFYDDSGSDPFPNSYNHWKSGMMYDGLHPNNNGYQVMADIWLAALEQYRPEEPAPILTPIYLLLLDED